MSIMMGNKILVAAEERIERQLTPQTRSNYLKVVVAGMKAGMEGGGKSVAASLRHSKDPIGDCAKGALSLCAILAKQSRGTMPVKAMIPAATTLMLHALDLAERLGLIKVTNDVLVKAMHEFTNHLFQLLKITPKMLQTAGGKLDELTSDPAKLEAMKRKAGIVRDPRASVPTTVQEE